MSEMKKTLALVAGLMLLVAAAGQAGAETRFAVQDAGGTVDKMVITDSGNIGIGTSNPTMAIAISKSGVTGDTSMLFHNTGYLPYNAYNSPAFFFMRNNDKSTNSGLPKSGDRLGSVSFGSILPTAYKYGANISSFAYGTWSGASSPGFITLATTGTNDSSPVERMRIDPEGNVGIGITPTQKLEIKGGIRLNTAAAKPDSCTSAQRGVIWVTQGGTGTADSLDICLKDASGNYSWVKIN